MTYYQIIIIFIIIIIIYDYCKKLADKYGIKVGDGKN